MNYFLFDKCIEICFYSNFVFKYNSIEILYSNMSSSPKREDEVPQIDEVERIASHVAWDDLANVGAQTDNDDANDSVQSGDDDGDDLADEGDG